MAANHVGNQRGRSSGQSKKGSAKPNLQSTVRSAASQASDALTEMRDGMTDCLSQGASQVRDMTRGHEGTTVLLALAAGFGVGIVIGCAMAPASKRSHRWMDRSTMEGFGRRLMDRGERLVERMEGMIPSSITEHLHR